MRLVLHNVTVVYFPVWTMPLFGCFSDVVYWAIRILELISLIPAGILTFSACRIMCQTRIFHFNMIILLVSALGQWFELLVARMLIIPYQEGWIAIEETVMEDKDTGIYQVSAKFLPLFIGGFLRTHYCLSVAIAAPCLVIERLCASIWIRTYEKRSRVYISTSMILISHVLSFFLSYQLVEWKYSYVQIVVTFTVVLSITLTTFAILYVYNSVVLKRLKRQHRSYGYHFGKRYQAEENLQTLKLVRRITQIAVTGVLFCSFFISLVLANLLPKYFDRFFLQLSEVILNLNPLYIIPPTVHMIPVWKSKMLNTLPQRLRRKLSSVRPHDYRVTRGNDSNAYWSQMTSHW